MVNIVLVNNNNPGYTATVFTTFCETDGLQIEYVSAYSAGIKVWKLKT